MFENHHNVSHNSTKVRNPHLEAILLLINVEDEVAEDANDIN